MDSDKALDFAFKYPFSSEAKEIVKAQPSRINPTYLERAGKHIDNATTSGLDYKSINMGDIKLDYIMKYLYCRMLLSAIKRPDLIRLYANAEASRSYQAMLNSENSDMLSIAAELGIRITGTFDRRKDSDGIEELSISFIDYIRYAPRLPSFELVNQKLSAGIVLINRNSMAKLIEQAVAKEIMKGLPIKSTELPKQVIEYSKGLRFKSTVKMGTAMPGKKTEEWIERLLQTPIADVRHRTVNIILAPYLVNTKGLEVEQATKIISDYIERCKQIDPDTKINESYIRYQCTYAKRRGLKPLSLERAKELLGNQIDLESNAVEVGKK